jgi:hypothetical protein
MIDSAIVRILFDIFVSLMFSSRLYAASIESGLVNELTGH